MKLTKAELKRARAQWKKEKSKRTFEDWCNKWVYGPLPGMGDNGLLNVIGYLVNGQMVPGPSPEGYVWDGVRPVKGAMGKRPVLQPPPGYVPLEGEDREPVAGSEVDEPEDPDMAELRKVAKELGWNDSGEN
ncbi:hypothetical protein [Rhodoblastus sp.]|jgi:hypothetical protein|uniref:hypothetical protein n=1 Tax=Rhodoblastus sp. TaxID=1962975 RepID=UPI0025D451C1|nr:hypothetical protein [Rhodoblastus sp.]